MYRNTFFFVFVPREKNRFAVSKLEMNNESQLPDCEPATCFLQTGQFIFIHCLSFNDKKKIG